MKQAEDQVVTASMMKSKARNLRHNPRARSREEMNATSNSLADRLLYKVFLVLSLVFISLVFASMLPAGEVFSSEVKSLALW